MRRMVSAVPRAAVALLALLVVSMIAPRVWADPPAPPDSAAEAKSRADDALVSGRPSEALLLYQQAYAIRRDPALEYNMGRAHQALGDFVAALDQLERFAATAPPDVKARVPGLEKLLAEVRKNVATIAVVADVQGAAVRLNDRIIGKTPLPGVVRVKAGPTLLVVEKEGHFAYERSVVLQGGGLSTFDVKLASRQTTAILTVRSAVIGAEVSVDGKREGTVPTGRVARS
jgi:tetratricopeptide (TPR) repeat protein